MGIAAGLGLARHFRVPILDQELISVVGSSVGSLLQKSADDGVKWGHWSHL